MEKDFSEVKRKYFNFDNSLSNCKKLNSICKKTSTCIQDLLKGIESFDISFYFCYDTVEDEIPKGNVFDLIQKINCIYCIDHFQKIADESLNFYINEQYHKMKTHFDELNGSSLNKIKRYLNSMETINNFDDFEFNEIFSTLLKLFIKECVKKELNKYTGEDINEIIITYLIDKYLFDLKPTRKQIKLSLLN